MSPLIKEFGAALIGGSVVAVIASLTTYFVGYDKIERPKILLEAAKMASEFAPKATIECATASNQMVSLGLITIEIKCVLSNQGNFPVKITKIDSLLKNTSKPYIKYESEEGDDEASLFKIKRENFGIGRVAYPKQIARFTALIHSSEGKSVLEPRSLLDVNETGSIALRVDVETIKSSSFFLRQAFPDSGDALNELPQSQIMFTYDLSRIAVPQGYKKVVPLELTPELAREMESIADSLKEVEDAAKNLRPPGFRIIP